MKAFFDVFPTLQVKTDLRDYFAETEVERLTTNRERTRYKVVLHSGHLIHKSRIYRMQEEISRQIFGDSHPEVYIDEHYALSAQYTPKRLMEEYYDSLVSEIGSFSHVMGLYFREARVDYKDDGSIVIGLEDSCLSRKMSFRLEEALNKIFTERCGVQSNLTVILEARKKKENCAEIRRVVPLQGAEAAFTVSESSSQELPPWDPSAAEQRTESEDASSPRLSFVKKEEGGQSGAAGGDRRGRKFSRNGSSNGAKKPFTLKRSNNPDVLYGREAGEPRNFYTEEDIELFDWAHSRFQADLSWTLDSAEIIRIWDAARECLIDRLDPRSTLESYYNEGVANLKDAGFTYEEEEETAAE